ncbi:predicted protein [Nematostella vectensis]|uniref:Uncharacterized protein n=1 Tax=Nematostella vectensis TaxID=45351 RepID=A7RJT5_NEMVE|nr:predicted protein [Nematostella vectensis]|eukprot:XP_001640390.1 predicted protein [Nematostella vectensis]
MADVEEEREAERIRRKCRTIEFSVWKLRVSFNPVVTFISAIIIWAFVVFCLRWTDLAGDSMPKGKRWVTKVWTWLYIGTQDVWAVFIAALYFSKYGKLKLGKDNEKPEYSDATYFTMLFAAGIGVGLFYFGVAEPIYHYEPGSQWGNRYQGSLSRRFADRVRRSRHILVFFGPQKRYSPPLHPYSDVTTPNPLPKFVLSRVIIIWCITAVATLSVISGVKLGIRRLSELCFSIGMFIWFVVLFYDDTWYILNIFCQSVGYYLQWIIQLGFHTDAFAQAGNAPDGKQTVDWMDGWTIFYWGWWIAWSPFVGTFIARISRGRTIQEFIMYTLTVPTIYSLMWFSVFGGAGLKMERNAAIAGINCSWPLGGATATEPYNGLYRLSCRPSTSMWFDVVESYGGLGPFMSGISLVSLVLYFVTSSDSGSLVIDSLSANGHPDPPVLQRIFWALTEGCSSLWFSIEAIVSEGATATALLWTGGKKALDSLQAASICSGLFYTLILNFIVVAMWRLLKIEMGDLSPDHPTFSMGILDVFYYPTWRRFKDLLIAIIAPWWPMGNAAGRLYGQNRFVFMAIIAVPFYGWLICEILQVLEVGLAYIGWAILFGFFAYGTGIRSHMRDEFKILGNLAEDFFAVMLLYPLAAMQMDEHMRHAHPRLAEVDMGKDNIGMNGIPPKDIEANNKRDGPPSYNDVDVGMEARL